MHILIWKQILLCQYTCTPLDASAILYSAYAIILRIQFKFLFTSCK